MGNGEKEPYREFYGQFTGKDNRKILGVGVTSKKVNGRKKSDASGELYHFTLKEIKIQSSQNEYYEENKISVY